jgi:Domain of unknown function (DUF4258)
VNSPNTVFRVHAVQRMFERNISVKIVMKALKDGVTIEDYSAEMPEPGHLVLGFQGKRPLHVVMSEDLETNQVTIITVYIPDPDKWNKDFRTRRS